MSLRSAAAMSAFVAWPLSAAAQPLVRVGPELHVNEYTTSAQSRPAAAAYAGGFVVVWASEAQDGAQIGVFARRRASDGQPLGAEFAVNTYTTGNQDLPAVAAAPDGSFVVAWTGGAGQDGHQDGIFARRFDATGDPLGPEFQVNTFTTLAQTAPALSIDGQGGFVIVWTSIAPGSASRDVFGQRYDASGAASGPEFRVNTYTTGTQYEASVAADAAGGFVVAWSSYGQDGYEQGIFARRFDAAGAPLGAEFRVNTITTAWQSQPRVAGDGNGAFTVAWSGPGALSGYDVFAQRYDVAGGPLGGEFRVNTYTLYGQTDPAIAMDPSGAFVVAWTSAAFQDGGDDGVFAQAFDASGAPAGPELQVNSYTTSAQSLPAVAAGGDGKFVVSWQSSGQDGSGTGVFAQRLLPDLIFADGFESGTLSAWSAQSADGGDLAASNAAALAGSTYGLEAVVDDTAGLFVQDDTPDGEGRYRARFYFDPNGFDPGEAEGRFRTRLFIAFEENPARRVLAVVLRRLGGSYSLRGRARLDDQSQADTPFVDVADGPHYVEVDWKRASGPGAADGSLEMWIDGTPVSLLTGLDNAASGVDFVRLGALSVKVGAGGTLYWDEFESHRENAIGP